MLQCTVTNDYLIHDKVVASPHISESGLIFFPYCQMALGPVGHRGPFAPRAVAGESRPEPGPARTPRPAKGAATVRTPAIPRATASGRLVTTSRAQVRRICQEGSPLQYETPGSKRALRERTKWEDLSSQAKRRMY